MDRRISEQRGLEEALRRLSLGLGIEKSDLYSEIDEDLRLAWSIFEIDDVETVKCIVICQLERLIDSYAPTDPKKRAVANVVFNLPGIPEHVRKTNLPHRCQWLAADLGDRSLPQVPIKNGDALLRKLISDFSEDLLTPPSRAAVASMVNHRFNRVIDDSPASPTQTGPARPSPAMVNGPARALFARPVLISLTAVTMAGIVALAIIFLPGKSKHSRQGQLNSARYKTPLVSKSVNSPPGSPSVSPPSVTASEGKAPIAIDSIKYKRVENLGLSFAFPDALNLSSSQLATLNGFDGDMKSAQSWASKLGGVATQNLQIQVVLRGVASGSTVITDMNVKASCGAPLNGALVSDNPGGGEEKDIGIGFNLDKPFPVALTYNNESFGAPYFSSHTISLRSGETQTLIIHAVTSLHYCLFAFRLEANNKGKSGTWPITDHGKPFAVSASANARNGMKWSDYKKLYVGGVLSPPDSKFKEMNPRTFNIILPDYG